MKNTTFVLIKSNFRDESEHMPIAVSKQEDWLIKKVPTDCKRMEGETVYKVIPTFVNQKTGEYYEIRQVDEILTEPYEGFDIYSLTKKKFKELANVVVYGKGQRRRVCLFLDWRNDYENGAIGYKYMLKGYGVTKKQILDDGYEILINKDISALCWYDYKEAKTEKERFKVPICG